MPFKSSAWLPLGAGGYFGAAPGDVCAPAADAISVSPSASQAARAEKEPVILK